jgi:hypothetical protein
MPGVTGIFGETSLLNSLFDGRTVIDFNFLSTSSEAENLHAHDFAP